eukprot:TRINITY_DN3562_c0_g8_i1.p1 TRINITY_DN3562_c0_g8~~TRINITY_DN3562_c0_g8_i1.p1  ORF type:complete len:1638 (-),score=492.31 TRINITY_DN3562_c0_g8_i1:1373-6286(-)
MGRLACLFVVLLLATTLLSSAESKRAAKKGSKKKPTRNVAISRAAKAGKATKTAVTEVPLETAAFAAEQTASKSGEENDEVAKAEEPEVPQKEEAQVRSSGKSPRSNLRVKKMRRGTRREASLDAEGAAEEGARDEGGAKPGAEEGEVARSSGSKETLDEDVVSRSSDAKGSLDDSEGDAATGDAATATTAVRGDEALSAEEGAPARTGGRKRASRQFSESEEGAEKETKSAVEPEEDDGQAAVVGEGRAAGKANEEAETDSEQISEGDSDVKSLSTSKLTVGRANEETGESQEEEIEAGGRSKKLSGGLPAGGDEESEGAFADAEKEGDKEAGVGEEEATLGEVTGRRKTFRKAAREATESEESENSAVPQKRARGAAKEAEEGGEETRQSEGSEEEASPEDDAKLSAVPKGRAAATGVEDGSESSEGEDAGSLTSDVKSKSTEEDAGEGGFDKEAGTAEQGGEAEEEGASAEVRKGSGNDKKEVGESEDEAAGGEGREGLPKTAEVEEEESARGEPRKSLGAAEQAAVGQGNDDDEKSAGQEAGSDATTQEREEPRAEVGSQGDEDAPIGKSKKTRGGASRLAGKRSSASSSAVTESDGADEVEGPGRRQVDEESNGAADEDKETSPTGESLGGDEKDPSEEGSTAVADGSEDGGRQEEGGEQSEAIPEKAKRGGSGRIDISGTPFARQVEEKLKAFAEEDAEGEKATVGKGVGAEEGLEKEENSRGEGDEVAVAGREGSVQEEREEGVSEGGEEKVESGKDVSALSEADTMPDIDVEPRKRIAAPKSTKKGKKREDISSTGDCEEEIRKFCAEVSPGPRSLADCISKRVKAEATSPDEGGRVSDKCRAEVRTFKAEMYRDINMDKKMAAACKTDMLQFCDDDFLYPEPGNIVACLREAVAVVQGETVSDACKAEIFRAKEDAAYDFKMDPQLNELCSSEAERLCKSVLPGGGRIQDCLRSERHKLGWDCQAELFRQEVENADDIRLNVRLFKACLLDKRKFCPEVTPGDARVKDCLENHRLEPDFSTQCKLEFDKMMERRASDFRLDPNLRKFCKEDIAEICYPDAEEITDAANWDAKVIQCLQDYREELKDAKCKQQVHQLTKRAAEDIRFDKPLNDACQEDRNTLCKDVPDGEARVYKCLGEKRDQLKESCRAALFDQEVRMAEDIDFKFAMKTACEVERKRFCKGVPSGNAAVIRCLQDKLKDADMGEDCKKEVERDQLRSAEDYRLNFRLNKACVDDIQKMCSKVCEKLLERGDTTCGGTVLKCLSENREAIGSEACRNEVFAFQKAVAADIRLDVPLQKACKADLANVCPKVSRDHSRTLGCLRKHRDRLSEACKEEEMRFSIMEASDIRLTPTLMNACGSELATFCRDVPATEGQAFKCLQANLQDVGMSEVCKAEVNLQQVRHSSDYRLDVRVRKECEADVGRLCSKAGAGAAGSEGETEASGQSDDGKASVLKCCVRKFRKLSASCQTEVAYAVRMSLFQYSLGSELTKACDPIVQSQCQPSSGEAVPVGGAVIGVFGQCLMTQSWKDMDLECKRLIKVASKEGAHANGQVDNLKLQETLDKLAQLHASMPADGVVSGGGLVLSGWMAISAIASLAVAVLAFGYALYSRCRAPYKQYTLVVKGGGQ